MKHKGNKWIAILVALFAIFTSVVISFGYFIANVTINGAIYDVTGTVDYTEADITVTHFTPNVSIVNGYPMTIQDAEKVLTPYSFTITNNLTTKAVRVQILLETKSSSNTIPDRLIDAKIEEKHGALTNTNRFASVTPTQTGYQSAYKLWEGTINPGSKMFNLLLWIDETGDNSGGANDVQNKSWQGKVVIKASALDELASDPSGANAPKLVENLIPVVYNYNTKKWQMTTAAYGNWYDYGEMKWANAVTVKQSKRGTYSVGDAIEMEDILGMWVWIPRYEYKYTNLGTSYAGGTQSQPGAISINFISGTSTTETTGYIVHPAFRNASSGYTNNAGTFTAYQIGGWDSELTGFWMGKFETSSAASASGTSSAVLNDPIVKPNVVARRHQKVAHQYQTVQNVATYHGISTMDSHMSKNSEWGAAVYLSQSIYGKWGNTDYSGANKEVYMNNSSNYITGRSMGMPSGASGYSTSAEGSYEYDVALNGTGASTTGNIYGIYDMAGGSWEYQMGWLSTASSNFGYRNNSGTDENYAGFSSAPSNHRYYEEYTTTTAATACGGSVCYGQALSETAGWYGDYTYMVSTTYPWFLRGARSDYSSYVGGGPFGFFNNSGFSCGNYGVRAVLV